MKVEQEQSSRRELLRAGGRAAALCGVAALAAALGWRWAASGGNECQADVPCASCGLLADCRLDRAQDFRRGQGGQG
jgi:hypothetical protein